MAKKIKSSSSSGVGKFVIGQSRFASISAVEGVTLSKRLKTDLAKFKGASADKRRAALAATYGGKK